MSAENNNSTIQPSEDEYNELKRGFIERLIALIRRSPDVREQSFSTGKTLHLRDVLDDNNQVKPQYTSWVHEKVLSLFEVLKG